MWKSGRDAWQEAQRKDKRKAEIVEHRAYDDNTGAYKVWKTNGKASLKAEDLLPEWEITIGGKTGLDYLKRYIGE